MIARLFRQTRKAAGLGQVEFAKQLGISQSALSKIENEQLSPDWKLFLWAYHLAVRHADEELFSEWTKIIALPSEKRRSKTKARRSSHA